MSAKNKTTSPGRRIAGWASNLLASGVILMAALVFGRQVTQWWRSEPRATNRPNNVAPRPLNSDDMAMSWIEFGDSPLAMRRMVHHGDSESALAELRRACRELIAAGSDSHRLPGLAEKRLLERIGQQQPLEREPGHWAIYQLDYPVPIVAAVTEETTSSAKVALPPRRVISWGLAFPSAVDKQRKSNQWTLFVWADESKLAGQAKRLDPPLPPNSRRSMMLCSVDGSIVCGVSGDGSPHGWREFYDQWHTQNGWSATGHWQELTENWRRRYQHPTLGTSDVQFSRSLDGMRGIWNYSSLSE